MALTAGTRIGGYEIVSSLGAGGMGEVYRARDTRLKRDVALKVLPAAVAFDRDRLARFEREAELLAALNHSNIAHVYGLERLQASQAESPEETLALVMELVEGEDLAARIARGPLPFDEALPVAKQIADALEAAHERGIVHRDLKPANIKVRPDGIVKVLDFGLAKLAEPGKAGDLVGPNLTQSPTITTPAMTHAGMILGTAAYMSPEQARGKPVDRRTDIWAFGAVFFEMVTGKRPFDGADVTDTLASVLRSEPDWTLIPADVSDSIRSLIRRCLEKDPQRRPSHLSVVTFLLSSSADGATNMARQVAPAKTVEHRWRVAVTAVVALVAGASAASAVMFSMRARQPAAASATPIRFTLPVETGGESWRILTDRPFVISPDGRAVVYRNLTGGQPRLFIRTLDSLEPRMLYESNLVRTPIFSPDSQWVAFFDGPALRKVPASGGPAVTICTMNGAFVGGFGASWGDDGSIVFAEARPESASTASGLMIVPASGGEPKMLTTAPAGETHVYPLVLPQSRGVLFMIQGEGRIASGRQLVLLDRVSGERRELVPAAAGVDYMAGRVVYADVQGNLYSLPFDLSRLSASGPAAQLTERVHVPPVGQPLFSLAASGAIAFVPKLSPDTEMTRSLVWVSRDGREEPIAAPPRVYAAARLSPDGTRIALDIRDEGNDIWTWSLDRGVLSRLTSGPTLDMVPIWTPDSRRIIWSSTRDNTNPTMYWQPADGTGAAVRLGTPGISFAGSVTPDGQTILFFGTGTFLFRMPLGRPGPAERFLGPLPSLVTPEISPDGRWIAFQSGESGKPEVYVRPYPNVDGGRWQISTQQGSRPAWSRNGRELFFLDGNDRVNAASIAVSGDTLVPGAPRRLLETAYYPGFTSRGGNIRGYDVTADGQRFLMIKGNASASESRSEMTIVLNWPPKP